MTAAGQIPATDLGVMDVGGGHVTAAVVGWRGGVGRILHRSDVPLLAHAEAGLLLDRFAESTDAVGEAGAVEEWVIAIPGPFDYAAGIGDFAGVAKFDSLAGVDVRAGLAQRLRIESSAVRFVNDAVAYGVGEWAFGTPDRPDRMICITLGTGVGSAFLENGHPVATGSDVPLDGHVHTLQIGGRPLEEVVSSPAIRDRYESATGRVVSVEAICALARDGDRAAIRTLDTTMRELGRALNPWVRRFGATRVVVGGGISASWDVIGEPFRDGVLDGVASPRPDGTEVVVSPALLPGDAPLLGAAEWRRRS